MIIVVHYVQQGIFHFNMFYWVRQGKELTQTLLNIVELQYTVFKEIQSNFFENRINCKDTRYFRADLLIQ